MANARANQILSQRQKFAAYGKFGGGTRVSLGSTLSSAGGSIAKRTVESELQNKVSQYNDGLITNEDMLDFLSKASNNPLFSSTEKVEINTRITDFKDRIVLEKLTTSYKNSPDGSYEQLQNAQAIASYYSRKASTLAPDTPAQQSVLQSAADWNSRIESIKSGINKIATQKLRYQEELKVNAIADNTSEQAQQKASMYKALYDNAVSSGDEVGANKYAAYYQDAITRAETLADSESTKANKKQLTDFINTTMNEYHDGVISGDEALAKLEQANQFAYDANDTAALNRLNGLSITINREIDKGVTYSNVNGLSTKSKGGSGGSSELYLNPDGTISFGGSYSASSSKSSGSAKGSSTTSPAKGKTLYNSQLGGSGNKPKSFSELEIEYKNMLSQAQKALVDGQAVKSGKTVKYDAKAYSTDVMLINKARQIELQNIAQGLDQLRASGVKKVGKTQIDTLIEENSKKLVDSTRTYNELRSGNSVLTIQNKTFTDESGVTYSKPQFTFVPKGNIKDSVNVNGIYYPASKQEVVYDDQNRALAYAKDKSTKDAPLTVARNSVGQYVVIDSEGKPVQRDLLTLQDPTGNSIVYEKDAKYGWLPQAVGPRTGALRKEIVKGFDSAEAAKQDFKPRLMTYNELNNFDFKTPVGITSPLPPEAPNAMQKAVSSIEPTVNKVVAAVKSAPSQVSNDVFNPGLQLIQPSMPAIRTANNNLQLAVQPTSAVQKLAQSTNMAPVKITAPTTNTPKITPTQLNNFNKQAEAQRNKNNQPITTQIKNAAKSVVNKISGLFK